MTPTISGSRLTFMRGSQNLDDTVNFLSIPPRLCGPASVPPVTCCKCSAKRACMRVTMYTGCLGFHAERLRACSLAFRACCSSLVCAGLCFFTPTISHLTRRGRKHATSKTKRPHYAHHASGAVWSSPCYCCLYIFSSAPSLQFHGKHCQLTGLMVGLDGR